MYIFKSRKETFSFTNAFHSVSLCNDFLESPKCLLNQDDFFFNIIHWAYLELRSRLSHVMSSSYPANGSASSA